MSYAELVIGEGGAPLNHQVAETLLAPSPTAEGKLCLFRDALWYFCTATPFWGETPDVSTPRDDDGTAGQSLSRGSRESARASEAEGRRGAERSKGKERKKERHRETTKERERERERRDQKGLVADAANYSSVR